MLDYTEYFKIFIGLLAIVDPLAAIPIFITMTAHETGEHRRKTINTVAFGMTIILLMTLFLGEYILQFFNITIDSFRVAGGILLLLMALAMLHARTSPIRQTSIEANESIEKQEVAIVPLAMPLLAGPGAISTVILAAHRSDDFVHYLVLAGEILVLSMIVWVFLRLSFWVHRHVSNTGINIFTRIMGLILAAIAVEFIANGVRGLFPVLA